MKTLILILAAAVAAIAQTGSADATDAPATTKGYYAGGVSAQGMFAVVGLQLTDTMSTYTNAGLAGTITVSQGIVRRVFSVNGLRFSLLGEAGAAVSGNTGFAGAVGGVLAYDIDKWTKIQGLSVIAVAKVQKTGDVSYTNYGIGLSKRF